MKRFWLFGGVQYYASGGMNDFITSFGSEAEAIAGIPRYFARPYEIEWWHVIDTQTGTIVAHSEDTAHGAENIRGNCFGKKPLDSA